MPAMSSGTGNTLHSTTAHLATWEKPIKWHLDEQCILCRNEANDIESRPTAKLVNKTHWKSWQHLQHSLWQWQIDDGRFTRSDTKANATCPLIFNGDYDQYAYMTDHTIWMKWHTEPRFWHRKWCLPLPIPRGQWYSIQCPSEFCECWHSPSYGDKSELHTYSDAVWHMGIAQATGMIRMLWKESWWHIGVIHYEETTWV